MLSVKHRIKGGSLVCVTLLLSIIKDFGFMDYTLVSANTSRSYETFGNNIKKGLTSDPKAILRALCLPFSE